MRWRGLALIAVLAGTGCSFRSALEDFCEDTGECACPDGNCCSLYKQTCGGIGCCTGMSCNTDGFCERDFEPKLVILGVGNTYFDLPAVEPGHSTSPVALEVKNDGVGPTTELQVKFEGSSRITADVSACEGRILQAGESCQVRLTAHPEGYAEYIGSLEVRELGRYASAQIRATGGAAVEVTASFSAPVSSTPAGIQCPFVCTHYFPLGTAVKLSIAGNAWGTHGVLVPTRVADGFCDEVSRTCDVVTNSRVEVTSTAKPNLTLTLNGAGDIRWTSNAFTPALTATCVGAGAGLSKTCFVSLQDTVTFTAEKGTVTSWSGACAGQGNSCTTQIPAGKPSTLEVTFQ